ncbi:hypothetical protein CMUST_15520 (plasmid) [Corynebacterium mustelae]|uniref:Lipoprotein n=1 Tax=Corynebacterium mustelae TaxID=571915 RepID=A0A0G3H6B4_9CORY|nr:hypothetical protein [Corynebacterium mustelae]AKK07393.1 hypothetical protein CMUST_15520 [Corynebacterium mustelae]
MNKTTITAVACAVVCGVLTISGCGHIHHDHPMEDPHASYGEPPDTTRPDWRSPYGKGFEDLAGKGPEDVAHTALERLCSFTPEEAWSGTVIQRINGVVTPALWGQISHNPNQVVPITTGPMLRQWEEAGGGVTVAIEGSAEPPPPNTDTTWHKKMVCIRYWDGYDYGFSDVYLVQVTKSDDVWKVARLELLGPTGEVEK